MDMKATLLDTERQFFPSAMTLFPIASVHLPENWWTLVPCRPCMAYPPLRRMDTAILI